MCKWQTHPLITYQSLQEVNQSDKQVWDQVKLKVIYRCQRSKQEVVNSSASFYHLHLTFSNLLLGQHILFSSLMDQKLGENQWYKKSQINRLRGVQFVL